MSFHCRNLTHIQTVKPKLPKHKSTAYFFKSGINISRVQKKSPHGQQCPHNSVVECFTRNEEVDGSIPSVGIFFYLKRLNQVDPFCGWVGNVKFFWTGKVIFHVILSHSEPSY